MSTFPAATIVGYPRIGPDRELKRALESYWAGKSERDQLQSAAARLRLQSYERLSDLGLSTVEAAIPASFSYYDQVLDVTALLGAIPKRFRDFDIEPLDLYFALARGHQGAAALEMTKWFNTNYHYLVPEIDAHTPISLTHNAPLDLYREAKEAGITVRPTLVGPVTYLLLAKGIDGYNPLDRLDDVIDVYAEVLHQLYADGVPWVQLDEPGVTSDNLGVTTEELQNVLLHAYRRLTSGKRPSILVTTPYGEAASAIETLNETDVEAIHVDLVHGTQPQTWGNKVLVAGIVNGRNIWRADLSGALSRLASLPGEVSVASSTSLQHVPYDASRENWESEDLALWTAFADQKVAEIVTLARGLDEGRDAVSAELALADAAHKRRHEAPGVSVKAIREATAAVTQADRERAPYSLRADAQAQRFSLPAIPTTTIGSFPQTPQIRQARALHAKGELNEDQYRARLEDEIRSVIALQEKLGLDVLVHGEPERNDMVQYFAENLEGFTTTKHGWVQSYGSRCTRPSVLWGDVSRSAPITVSWSTFAQSLTDKPVKGMLTGPVTILAWSFVREDLPLGEVADQVGLALREEVGDLEAAGIGIIQVDEPALRELLPLRLEDQQEYLEWSIGSFRLATSGVRPDTQIHTHLCYSEFGDVISAIDDLNADVTSLEAARSHMEVLPELAATGFDRGIGPGVYDIHSPQIPTEEQITELLALAAEAVPAQRLWSNPDCGLKTRTYQEVIPSLENLVRATATVRAQLEVSADA